ncbi:MAG: helix-turn-helix transcriptional regulator [Clostridia bacterium]|nr:helix-turn-helix transcriptional regulator [Clostridia bacterium]
MYAGFLKFDSIPDIGFSHRFYTDKIEWNYGTLNESFEIAYITKGTLIMELYDEKTEVQEGSVLILFRHLPIKLSSSKGCEHSHITVQAEFNYSFEIIEEDFLVTENDGVILPFVIPPCEYTEQIMKDLNYISNLSANGENELACSLRFCSIMSRIDEYARNKTKLKNYANEKISKRVAEYIDDNIDRTITLDIIASKLCKSPNYINASFKKARGVTIKHYINSEKVKRICDMIHKDMFSFKEACKRVGIDDVSYGYRLFKQYTGITPKEFLKITKIKK